jgi:hypothetical protein
MTELADMSAERRAAVLARQLGVGVAVVGSLVLFGWVADVPELKSVAPGLATMKPNTAAAFVLAGICLWLVGGQSGRASSPRAVRLARTLVAAVGLLGLLTLGQYAFDQSFGIDQLLIDDP